MSIEIAVLEDDRVLRDRYVELIECAGDMRLAWVAGTVGEALRALNGPGPNVLLSDLGLPDGSGFTLLSEWRACGAGPAVIVLTSHDDELDCVASLEAGADDFVAKPFSPRALVARVRAVLRRGAAASVTPSAAKTLVVDLERRSVRYAGRVVELTKLEFDLLATLADAPGRVHTRDHLVARVWGGGHALTERTVDSHVKALRRKLTEAGAGPAFITAVRGVGFKLCEAP